MQPGDIVICINKDKLSNYDSQFVIREEITIGKQYKALPYPPSNVWQEKPWIIIKDDLGNQQSLMKSQFMLLEDWRQQQLDKLL
jgi:hypothetical protein